MTKLQSNSVGTRAAAPPVLKLEHCAGFYSTLAEIKTSSKYKNKTIDNIKSNLRLWMANNNFKPFRKKQLDIAIVIKCCRSRMKKQDTDNMAKVICDSLKKRKDDTRYLFEDDCQIVRLLVWKIQKANDQCYATDSCDISFRIHDCNKPMTLIEAVKFVKFTS